MSKFKVGDRVVLSYKIDKVLIGKCGVVTSPPIESRHSSNYFYYFIKLDYDGTSKSPAEHQLEHESVYNSSLWKELNEV